MASDELSAAEAQWREQFDAMKAAVAQLKLPSHEPTCDDIEDSDFEGYLSGRSGQDVWDFISDDGDEDESSGDFIQEDAVDGVSGTAADWFIVKCHEISAKNGLSPDDFQTQIMSLLSSGLPEDELQAHLSDLIGFDHLDFIIRILADQNDIIAAMATQHQNKQRPTGGRLLTKSQREEVLRRQDIQHKSASLAPSMTREVHYPHVYKSYSAGNTLSYSGQKYGLPVGSERKQFEKYEEYAIPAGRKGVLGPGQKLVKISDLDGLCRNTFVGYKNLNRMQSLVYPVAYKTHENLLVCAPTGAVRSQFSFSTLLCL